MKMKNISILVLLAGLLGLGTVSCEPEYDTPPVATIPEGQLINIDTIWHWYAANGSMSITEDYSLYGVVTTDESSGAFYKEVYIKDDSRAIRLRLTSSSSLTIGDSIRVYLKGTYIDNYSGLMQLDSVDPDENIIIQSNGNTITPLNLNIGDLTATETIGTTDFLTYQSQLVQLQDVEMTGNSLGTTWADEVNQLAVNLELTDCFGSTVLVRTSGYANFAGDAVPEGNGIFIGVVGVFDPDVQLYVRTPDELILTGNRCTGGAPLLSKDFEDGVATSGGWQNLQVNGGAAVSWETGTQAAQFGSYYGQISNYNGSGNDACETWLVSPSVDLSGTTAPYLNFWNAYNYTGDALEVYVSTNYSGSGDPTVATWTQLSPTLSTGGWDWVDSGNMDLSSYISPSTYVAFVYTGGSSNGSTWEIDEIKILD